MKNVNVIDCYALLGVPRDATAEQIEVKWREIQARYHPDQYQGLPEHLAMVAKHKLREIDAAADVLLDTARRAELDESLREAERRSALEQRRRAATPPPVADAKPAGPASDSGSASVAPPRKTTRTSDRAKAGGSRRAAVLGFAVIAIALIAVFAATRRPSKELATPSPSAKATSPTPKPPQTYAPPPKVAAPPPKVYAPPPQAAISPPQAAAPPPQASTRGIPVEFLQAFQQYATKPGNKAIALALDSKGRWAHGSISGYSTQPAANEEALSECTRFKAQADVQENCRLFAIGDKVVW